MDDDSLKHLKDEILFTRIPHQIVSAMEKCIEDKKRVAPCDANFKNKSNLIRFAIGRLMKEEGFYDG